MKMYWENEGTAPHNLKHGTRWRLDISFTYFPPYPQSITVPCTYWTGCWVDTRTDLDMMTNRKVHDPARNRATIVEDIASNYTDRGTKYYNPNNSFHLLVTSNMNSK